MSIMQPQSPPKPKPTVRTRLKDEGNHFFVEMKPLQLCLFALPSILLLPINPLLPPVAYALGRWAGSTWAWRDRWTSVWIWAKQGAWWSAILAGIVVLGRWHVWFFPELITAMQAFWQAHLPGTLSLSPLDPLDLPARILLLLPLAPVLSLLYEWIDPRTRVRHHRVLTPAERALSAQPTDPSRGPAKEAPTTHQASPPGPSTPPKTPKKKRRTSTPREPAAQMTIESFLAPDQTPAPPPTKTEKLPEKSITVAKNQVEPSPPITEDWNDMAE